MIAAFFYMSLGALLSWIGWRHWRYRNEESISLLESTILTQTGDEPLPRTGVDRFLTYVQAIFGFVLGPFFFLIGLVIVLSELGMI
ncbi:MAG: hypothetical protein LH466_06390 [Sphingomonas bacterium]|nr:hypothetical protein [Sphingomonas bacterium]